MKTRSFHASLTLFVSSVLLFTVGSSKAVGPDPAITKLYGKWVNSSSHMGRPGSSGLISGGPQVAATDKWIIVGAPEAKEGGTARQGAVQVFNAATGAWVRKLLPPTSAGDQNFGVSVAISGDLGIIGTFDTSGGSPGIVYVHNLATGALVRTLVPGNDGANGDFFGGSVAVAGNIVMVGSSGSSTFKGSAYVFNLATGAKLFKLTDPSAGAADLLGASVAITGNIGIAGAPNMGGKGGFVAFDLSTGAVLLRTNAGASASDQAGFSVAVSGSVVVLGAPSATVNAAGSAGKIYTFDLTSQQQRVFTLSDAAQNDLLGYSVCAQGGMLLAGAAGKNSNVPNAVYTGAAYVFDLKGAATTELRKLARPDEKVLIFGTSVALDNNTAYVTAPDDANSAGSLLVYKPITKPMPMTKVTAKTDYAPGAEDCNFNLFSDVYLNADGEAAFTASLTGAGSHGSKDTGVWDMLGTSHTLDLGTKSVFTDGALSFGTVSKALCNGPSNAAFQTTLTGAGVTALNNLAIYSDDGSKVTQVHRTGNVVSAFPAAGPAGAGAAPATFTQVVESRLNPAVLATACTLRLGINGTDATTDSGILLHPFSGAAEHAEREGGTAAGVTYGQFAGRVAMYDSLAVYSAAVVATADHNAAIFSSTTGGAVIKLQQKGTTMAGTDTGSVPGVSYASFIGESCADDNVTLYRATVAGTGITAANNEGLWRWSGNVTKQILRKGVDLGVATPGYNPPSGMTGVKILKFIAFWETFNQQLALVQLIGTGVTAANDQALVLFENSSGASDTLLALMREGDPAPGCPGATIGVISRVEVEPYYGHYLVLATLAGVTPGTEQALFRGFSHASATATTHTLRRPYLILRKGQLFDNQPSKVLSINLPANNLTAAGAGTTGSGNAMQGGFDQTTPRDIAIVVDFANGVRQVMKGTP